MIYVNPTTGNDANPGTAAAPLKTISRALKTASPTSISLAPGTYSDATGEIFPLVVPSGVTLLGLEVSKGYGILISGGGSTNIPGFTGQNVAIVLEDKAQLRGVTVTAPQGGVAPRSGIAVVVPSASPTLANNTFANSLGGVVVSGSAKPIISDNTFTDISGNAIVYTGNAKGEIRRNLCQRSNNGINIAGEAAPLITDNRVTQNRTGIMLAGFARPVFRNNWIENNSQIGLNVTENAVPELGNSAESGGNILRNNGQYDLQNTATAPVVTVGNQLNQSRVKGSVDFKVTDLADARISTPNATIGTADLTDIPGHWAADFIAGLVNQGLISGFPDKTFKPDAPLTRVQYAAILAKAFNENLTRAAINFSDVPNNFWGKDAIIKAYRMGFITGFPDNTFRPNQNLTRVQAVVSLASGLRLTGGSLSDLGFFADRAQIPSYATDEIAAAIQNRILINYPRTNQIEPLRDITRAEASAFIYQALVARNKLSPIDSPYIVKTGAVLPTFGQLLDIKGHWAESFISRLYNQGIIGGFQDGTFKPDTTITRAAYAALIIRAFKLTAKRPAATFQDLSPYFWGYNAIQQAYQAGFVSGFPDNTFRPNENLQRLQVILSLVSGLGLSGGSLNLIGKYADNKSIPDYGKNAVATATQNRLIVNYPTINRLEPIRAATRAEVAVMVYQALVNAGQIEAMDFPYIVSA
ncbi:MAG: hypothetical protein Fur0025_36950 [Oscillatoriaceae cyanobacterium]